MRWRELIDPEVPPQSGPLDGVVIVVLAIICGGGVTDLILDQPTSWWSAHVLLELGLIATSATLAITLWLRWKEATSELRRTRRSLTEREDERAAWQATAEAALQGLRDAVTTHMTRWGLTPAEREVALLLLQGLGHKQIAARTGRSERTARQHAVSVYDKSGLDGRAALAGFFLQGLEEGKEGERW